MAQKKIQGQQIAALVEDLTNVTPGATDGQVLAYNLANQTWDPTTPSAGSSQDTQVWRLTNNGPRTFDQQFYSSWTVQNPGSVIGGGFSQPNYVTYDSYFQRFDFQQSGTYAITIARQIAANIQPNEDIILGISLSATGGASMLSPDQHTIYRPPPGFATSSNNTSQLGQWMVTSAANLVFPFGTLTVNAYAGAYINSSETYTDELWVYVRRIGDAIAGT